MREATAAPTIVRSPVSQAVSVDADVTLSVQASVVGKGRYQWRRNGVNIPGATDSTLRLDDMRHEDAGAYHVVVSDATGVASSAVAVVMVQAPVVPFVDNVTPVLAGEDSTSGELAGTEGIGWGINTQATLQAGENGWAPSEKRGGRSVWVSWQPKYSGNATLSTHGSAFDTMLSVFRRGVDGGLNEVAANDDASIYHTSAVVCPVEAGVRYWIRVDGLAGDAGDILIRWNLDRSGKSKAPKVTRKPGKVAGSEGSRADLRVEFDEEAGVEWVKNGWQVMKSDAPNLWSVMDLANLTREYVGRYAAKLRTGDGVEVWTEPVHVQIQRGGSVGVSTDDKFAEHAADYVPRPGVAAHSPRRRPGRQGGLASGYSGTQIFSTEGSTTEMGEPNHCAVIGGASEWYSYQAAAAGLLTIDTSGSDFDTVLAVYTGSSASFASLNLVGCNDNFDGQPWSRVTLQAVAGTVYYIAVDGAGGASGTASLNYRLTSPPSLSSVDPVIVEGPQIQAETTFLVTDPDGDAAGVVVTANSSNPGLVPPAGLSVVGTGALRTLRLALGAGAAGVATVTLTATDPDGLSVSTQFEVRVTRPNAAPTLGALPVLTIDEDHPPLAVPLSLGDPDGEPAALAVTVESSNPALFPPAGILVRGLGANRELLFAPGPDQHGEGTLAIIVSDGGTSVTSLLRVTVMPVNDPPVLSPLPDVSVRSAASWTPPPPPPSPLPSGLHALPAGTSVPWVVAFSVADRETPPDQLQVRYASSNAELLPINHIGLAGSGGDRTLLLTPVAGRSGTSLVSVWVSDGSTETVRSFVFRVDGENRPPTISMNAQVTVAAGSPVPAVLVRFGDPDNSLDNLEVRVSSSNPELLSASGVRLSGSGGERTLIMAPQAGVHGEAHVTVTVSDGLATASATLTLQVLDPNGPPQVSMRREASGLVRLRFAGAGGRMLRVEWSEDLRQWHTLLRAQANDSSEFLDWNLGGAGRRFYRVTAE